MNGLIDELRRRSAELRATLAANGIQVALLEPPEDAQKQSLTVVLDSPERFAQITVWETGEVELEFAEVASGETFHEHQQIADSPGLQEALDRLTDWTSGSAPPP